MAEALIFLHHIFTFLSLFSLGLYHLISAVRSFLKPSPHPYSARPYHPLPFPRFPSLPFLLSLLSLLLSLLLHLLLLPSLSSLRTSLSLLLFLLILSLSFLSLIPSDLIFLLSSLSFSLLSFTPLPSPDGDLSYKTDSVSATISLSSAAFALILALSPKLFLADIALSASILLKSLWSLQTLLSLHVDAFVPDGCHRLLDLPSPSTRCDIDEIRTRAAEILNVAFAVHAVLVAVIVVVVYGMVARGTGGGMRRSNGGSYEALPTVASGGSLADVDHVQMKAIGKSSAQE